MNDDIERFRSQCFLYVCDKLDAKDIAWMEDMLRRHPELQKEVDEDRLLATQTRQALTDEREQEDYQPLVPFEQLRRATVKPAQQGVVEKLKDWWQTQAGTPARNGRWALAAMLVLGVMVTFQTRHLLDDGEPATEYRALEGGTQLSVLEVVFKPDVSIGDIRDQLTQLNARIISGPDRSGVYEIEIARASMQTTLQALKDSPLVNTVQMQDLRSRDSR